MICVGIGTANNAGAILVLGRDLVVVPKLIHPLPPAISSPDASPEHHTEDTWMQVLHCSFYKSSSRWCIPRVLDVFFSTGSTVFWSLDCFFCCIRNSMPTGPRHQPGADLNHQMIEVLLPGYSNHLRDAAVNHILCLVWGFTGICDWPISNTRNHFC